MSLKALICGISGQDGAYLAQLLLEKGYEVYGTSRDAQVASFKNLDFLSIRDHIKFESMTLTDFRSVLQVLSNVQPDEVYNLAGQTSVGLSFSQPVETLESIATGTLNLLEVIRFLGRPVKLYNASSSECFGDLGQNAADENTPFHPRSPYAVAKATAFWQVSNYREAYGLFACSGILFNHESPIRPERFVTQKIISTTCKISKNNSKQLHLGNLSIQRDWGWAPEYVEAMYLMLQSDKPDDFVIATGQSFSLQDFVSEAFGYFSLDWKDYVISDPSFIRPTELNISRGNPQKANQYLSWQAKNKMPDVVRMMIEAELKKEIIK
jgi:GDPmannose 4,6-dehydratase